MKNKQRTRSILSAMVLSTVLAGNVYAGDLTGVSVYNWFGGLVESVYAMVSLSPVECPPRQCQSCRPNDRENGGNCRPTGN